MTKLGPLEAVWPLYEAGFPNGLAGLGCTPFFQSKPVAVYDAPLYQGEYPAAFGGGVV